MYIEIQLEREIEVDIELCTTFDYPSLKTKFRNVSFEILAINLRRLVLEISLKVFRSWSNFMLSKSLHIKRWTQKFPLEITKKYDEM